MSTGIHDKEEEEELFKKLMVEILNLQYENNPATSPINVVDSRPIVDPNWMDQFTGKTLK